MPDQSLRENAIMPLLPRIQQTVLSRTLRYVVFETDVNSVHEAWRLLPRYKNPFWIQMEFDLLTSSVEDEREVRGQLQRFVDAGIMDVSMNREGYYGFSPLIFLYQRTQEIDYQASKQCLGLPRIEGIWLRLTEAFGTIEEMRKGKPEFVSARQIVSWTQHARFLQM
jgi:hypothetical protein